MRRTESLRFHPFVVLVPFLLLIQALVSCGGDTSVALCASTGPNNNFCSGFGSSGGSDNQARAAASVDTVDAPAGLYSIDRIVDRPFVNGVVLRLSWAALEPEPGVYRFEKITETVSAAQAVQQKVTLVLQLDVLPEWLATRQQGVLSRLAGALGSLEINGVLLRRLDAVGLVTLAGDGLAQQGVIELWRAVFAQMPLAIETDDIASSSTVVLPGSVFWLYTAFATDTVTQRMPIGADSPLLLRACGAWIDQHAWPRCTWSESDSPDTALAVAVQQQGAAYFEFNAADLESVDYYSQFEYWSSVINPL